MFRFTIVALVLPAMGVALAACGSSAQDSGATNRATTSGSPVAFSRCMRANGVPSFPDPQGGGIRIEAKVNPGSGQAISVNGVPVNAPAFQAAQRRCQKSAPIGGRPSAAQLARLRAGALAMARCMRAHGVANFPDPTVRTGPGGFGIGVRIGPGAGNDPSSPAFAAAAKLCKPLMGKFGAADSRSASAG